MENKPCTLTTPTFKTNDNKEDAFDAMVAEAQITPSKTARRRRAKRKKRTKDTQRSTISRLEYWSNIKERQWRDDEYDAGKDW
jgi:hypothetical protein